MGVCMQWADDTAYFVGTVSYIHKMFMRSATEMKLLLILHAKWMGSPKQGILTEGEVSVWLTSLY